MYMSKNLDRGFKDISIFEIGPVFKGSNPGQQNTVVCGLSAGKKIDYPGLIMRGMLTCLM